VRYFEKIFFPLLKNFGIEASVKINEEGYYPWGGGEAEIKVQPVKLFFRASFIDIIIAGRKRVEAN